MYKLTIEEIVGEVRKITTLETEDVELVKLLLLKEERIQVDSDVPNRNIDKEWQELLDWYKKSWVKDKSNDNGINPYEVKPFTDEGLPYPNQKYPGVNWPSPLTTPFSPTQFPGHSPFTVTC